jgi:hypothetical protein
VAGIGKNGQDICFFGQNKKLVRRLRRLPKPGHAEKIK